MNFPIDLTTLSNDDLIKAYANVSSELTIGNPGRESVIAMYKKEFETRIDLADSLALFEIAQLVAKYFYGSFDSPIRKKITYSPTGKKAPAWIGFFSRKNKGLGSNSD